MKKKILKVGNKLTRIGEKYNIRPLIYNPIIWLYFLVHSRREGKVFTLAVKKVFPNARTFADVGSGAGGYVVALRKSGNQCIGYEYSSVGRLLGRLQGAEILPLDCSKNDIQKPARKCDLVFTIEVGEHIPAQYSDKFVDFICACSDIVVFSSAHPNQGGHGHINEQPKAYWEDKFRKRQYLKSEPLEVELKNLLMENDYKGWLPTNLQVFTNKPA